MKLPRLVGRRSVPELRPEDENVRHQIGWLEGWVSAVLHRVPRSLCGVIVMRHPDDPDRPAPDCPACRTIQARPLIS